MPRTKIYTVERTVVERYCVEAASEEDALFKEKRGKPHETTKSIAIVDRGVVKP